LAETTASANATAAAHASRRQPRWSAKAATLRRHRHYTATRVPRREQMKATAATTASPVGIRTT